MIRKSDGTPGSLRQEIAEGVVNMQLQYLVPGGSDYVDASSVTATDWPSVSAARVVLTLESNERVGIERSEEHTSELKSLMRISYAVFCLKKKHKKKETTNSQ